MSIDLVVGVWTQRWVSLGLSELSLWLRGRPWSGQGSLLVARAPRRDAEHARTMVEAELRASYGGEVWLVELEATRGQRLQDLLLSWCGVELASIRELAETLRPVLELQNRLFIVNLPGETLVEGWLDDAKIFLDRLSKAGPGVGIGLLVIASSSAGNTTRLELAWPLLEVRSSLSASWGSYLHERIAWHSGGDIDTAEEVAESVAVLQTGQDLALEKAFDHHSQTRLAHLPTGVRMGATADAIHAATSAGLLLHPMLPCAGSMPRPVPWFARAVLLERPAHPQRHLLHSTIACRPLAARLLGRLIDLEGHLRDVLTRAPRLPPPPEDLERRFFQATAARSIDRLLDPMSRRPLNSAWDIAGYGDLVSLLPPGDIRERALLEARLLRNALAHGSAACWEAIQRVDDLESRLA